MKINLSHLPVIGREALNENGCEFSLILHSMVVHSTKMKHFEFFICFVVMKDKCKIYVIHMFCLDWRSVPFTLVSGNRKITKQKSYITQLTGVNFMQRIHTSVARKKWHMDSQLHNRTTNMLLTHLENIRISNIRWAAVRQRIRLSINWRQSSPFFIERICERWRNLFYCLSLINCWIIISSNEFVCFGCREEKIDFKCAYRNKCWQFMHSILKSIFSIFTIYLQMHSEYRAFELRS